MKRLIPYMNTTMNKMVQKAEVALGLPSTKSPPMLSGPSLQKSSHTPFILPGIFDLSISLFAVVSLLIIAFYPYSSPVIEELRKFFGPTVINVCLFLLVSTHTTEALIAYIVLLMRGEEDTKTLAKWVVAAIIYGHVWLLWKDQNYSAKKKSN